MHLIRKRITILFASLVLGGIFSTVSAENNIATADTSQQVKNVENLIDMANQGNPAAQNLLGNLYTKGQGVPLNYAQAAKWYRLAADQNFFNAQLALGKLYFSGLGVAKDESEAAKWFRKAADEGLAPAQFLMGTLYEAGHGVPQDYAEALKWFFKADKQGYLEATNAIGVLYENGRGVQRNYTEAINWYNKAAVRGNASAQINLGMIYRTGRGVQQDDSQALNWYRKAAEQGQTTGEFMLGSMYAEGRGVAQNYVEAVKWFQKAADQGFLGAQSVLGIMYDKGKGLPQDYTEAYFWIKLSHSNDHNALSNADDALRHLSQQQISDVEKRIAEWKPAAVVKSTDNPGYSREVTEQRKAQTLPVNDFQYLLQKAMQGDAEAQENLAMMYRFGSGAPQDYSEAAKWFQKAAEQGRSKAQYWIGFLHWTGQGTPKDFVLAYAWLTVAAAQGDTNAPQMLEHLEKFNLKPDDLARALALSNDYLSKYAPPGTKYVKPAVPINNTQILIEKAKSGDAASQFTLGVLYENGTGVSKDYTEAAKWIQKAAEQGLAGAQNTLGNMYAHGLGVPQDNVKAYAWLTAAGIRIPASYIARERPEKLMSPADLSKARELGEEYIKQYQK